MESNSKFSVYKVLPVLLGFFIMGFVDVVGIATNYIKLDFSLSDKIANLLPMMVFIWFFIFSIPSGLLMNKIGRKKTVIISFVIQTIALIIPIFGYNFNLLLLAFALLGIGNTMLQVSLNPLLSNVVSDKRLASSLTLGQFVKAIASFSGPILAAFFLRVFDNWQLLFPFYAFVTLISSIWLIATPIRETPMENNTSSFKECLSLLGNKGILLLFLGIFTIVGIDVGLNTTAPKIMQERTGMLLENAGYATSLYFAFKTAGAFLGSIILSIFSVKRFYIVSSIAAILAFIGLIFAFEVYILYACIALAGFACANMFSIIFSYALKYLPSKANEISGLMIMGVSGGAVFPWLMGVASDSTQTQIGAIIILIICCIYQLMLSIYVKETK